MSGHDWADNTASASAIRDLYVCTRCGALSGNFASRPRPSAPLHLVMRTDGSVAAVTSFAEPADPTACDTETARKVVES